MYESKRNENNMNVKKVSENKRESNIEENKKIQTKRKEEEY